MMLVGEICLVRSPADRLATKHAAGSRKKTAKGSALSSRPVSGLATPVRPPSRTLRFSGLWVGLAILRSRSLTVAGAAQVGTALPWRRRLAPCFPLNCNPVVNRITSTWNVRECRQFRGKRQCRGKSVAKRLKTGIKPSPRMPLSDDACNFGARARSHTPAFAVRTIALGLKSQNPRP